MSYHWSYQQTKQNGDLNNYISLDLTLSKHLRKLHFPAVFIECQRYKIDNTGQRVLNTDFFAIFLFSNVEV